MDHSDEARDRAWMVEMQIRRRGITDPRVLRALSAVPRERFVPERMRARAYADQALAVGHGQTISQPFIVAAMTAAACAVRPERVLEIGTGSGYQAAVLAHLAEQVYSIERIPELASDARSLLAELGIENVHIRVGDGSLGWPDEAPFQAILVTAGAPATPPSLLRQLDEDGGRLVVPVGEYGQQELLCVVRQGTAWTTERMMACRFVPLLGEEGWSEDAL